MWLDFGHILLTRGNTDTTFPAFLFLWDSFKGKGRYLEKEGKVLGWTGNGNGNFNTLLRCTLSPFFYVLNTHLRRKNGKGYGGTGIRAFTHEHEHQCWRSRGSWDTEGGAGGSQWMDGSLVVIFFCKFTMSTPCHAMHSKRFTCLLLFFGS